MLILKIQLLHKVGPNFPSTVTYTMALSATVSCVAVCYCELCYCELCYCELCCYCAYLVGIWFFRCETKQLAVHSYKLRMET